MTDPEEKKRLEESLRRMSWWNEPAPGLWKRALNQSRLPQRSATRRLVAVVRTQWPWLVGAAAATIVLATVLEHTWQGLGGRSAADPRGAVVQTSPNQTAETAPSAESPLLAVIPRFSGPIPPGWSPGLNDANIVLAAGPGDRLLAGETLADRQFLARGELPGGTAFSGADSFDPPLSSEPAEVKTTTTQKTLIVPAGRYNTIVLGAHGTAPMAPALIELQRGDDTFPISAVPGSNYFITFTEGWEVQGQEARVMITSTTSTSSRFTSAEGFAWGITARGPVAFPEAESN